MRDLHGRASELSPAPVDACLALLAAIDAYPDWHPEAIREVEVLERDGAGQPTRVVTVLHVEVAGFDRDFHLTMDVDVGRGRVALRKVKADDSDPPFDVTWNLSKQDGTVIALELDTALPVPRLVPLGGVGDSIARSFVNAAVRALSAKSS